ncbi:MAG TPA: histidine kinase [Pseudonocardiaceae bacterium]|nr:histidine kinase [Pseudonocardiaceae bacterium]
MNPGQRPAGHVVSPSPRDSLLAAVLFLVFVLVHLRTDFPGEMIIVFVAGAVLTLSLTWRRRQPLRVWLVTTLCALFLLGTPLAVNPFGRDVTTADMTFVLIGPLIALFTVTRDSRQLGRLALGGSLIALCVPLLWSVTTSPDAERNALLAAAFLVTAWALGEMVRTRTESGAARSAALEREKAEHDRTVAAEERARIARELHDITAHHISVVTLQAGAARLLAESGEMPGVELLSGIETAGRQAMMEIRQALGVIRSSPDGAAPLPGIEQLPDLADRLGSAGVEVTLDGTPGPLPHSLGLTVYRIVQEGLTNVARHSAARAARVSLRREQDFLAVTITDDGPPRTVPLPGPGGHGLTGLRERVSGYGGHLHAGTRPDGGFELRADLPVVGAP